MTALDIIRAHEKYAANHGDQLRADEVLAALDVDVDEGTSVSYADALALALTLYAVASELATMRATMADAHDVPPVTLAEAVGR